MRADRKWGKRTMRVIKTDGVPVSLPVQSRPARPEQTGATDAVDPKQTLIEMYRGSGSVFSSPATTGNYGNMKQYCKNLIETCAPGGGFVPADSAQAGEANPGNLNALLHAAKEYGNH